MKWLPSGDKIAAIAVILLLFFWGVSKGWQSARWRAVAMQSQTLASNSLVQIDVVSNSLNSRLAWLAEIMPPPAICVAIKGIKEAGFTNVNVLIAARKDLQTCVAVVSPDGKVKYGTGELYSATATNLAPAKIKTDGSVRTRPNYRRH